MKKVYLVRHGKRESHHEDTLLSNLGVKQAEVTGKYFKDKNIKNLFASPLPRTQQTAKIISESLKLEIKTEDRLKERFLWDERAETYDDFLNEWHRAGSDINYRSNGRDSVQISGDRLKSVIEEVPDGENSLIIAHGGIIGDYLMGNFPNNELPFQRDKHDNSLFVEILECSITEVQINDSETSILRVNDFSHLLTPLE